MKIIMNDMSSLPGTGRNLYKCYVIYYDETIYVYFDHVEGRTTTYRLPHAGDDWGWIVDNYE